MPLRLPLRRRVLDFSYFSAVANWVMWRQDFEWCGAPEQLPILADPKRLRAFRQEYKVFQGQTVAGAEAVRLQLYDSRAFASAVRDVSGAELDELAISLAHQCNGLGKQRSLVSKLATFARPSVFVPWDKFAKKGAAMLSDRRGYDHYVEYLADVNAIWRGEIGNSIRSYLNTVNRKPRSPRALGRRMLDIILMRHGGRWLVAGD